MIFFENSIKIRSDKNESNFEIKKESLNMIEHDVFDL